MILRSGELSLHNDGPSCDGPPRETGGKGIGATQSVNVESEGGLPEQALESAGQIGKESSAGQVGKVVCEEVEVEVVKTPLNPRLVRVSITRRAENTKFWSAR
jgi:hypothetical protein